MSARFNGGRQKARPDRRGQIKCTALICCEVEVLCTGFTSGVYFSTTAVHSRTHREITPHEWHSEAPKAPNNDFQNPPLSIPLSRRQIISFADTFLRCDHGGILTPDPCRCLAGIFQTHYAAIGRQREGQTP